MSMNPLQMSRATLKRVALVAITVVVAVAALLVFLHSLVPREITFLAGPEGSTYYAVAEFYREALVPHGIAVRIVETAGAVENLETIASAQASRNTVTLAQSGLEALVMDPDRLAGLVSLGSVYVEPFWLFAQRDTELRDEVDLIGRLVVPGQEGSAIRAITEMLLTANGMPADVADEWLDELPPDEVYDVLAAGEADAAFMIGLPGALLIDELLGADFLEPVTFDRSAAYERRGSHITTVTLPEGAFDLARNIPSEDLELLAAVTQLIVHDDMSATMVELLMDVATQVHRGATLFKRRGEFPTPEHASFPIDPAAERYYSEGRSTVRKILPFWIATLVDRFALVAAAVAAMLLAALQILPALMRLPFSITKRHFVHSLVEIEQAMGREHDPDDLERQINELADAARQLEVPRMLGAEYNELCQLIFDASERLAADRERRQAASDR